jgi:hypothetical protein
MAGRGAGRAALGAGCSQPCRFSRSAERSATSCSACRFRIAITSSSAPRPRRCWRAASSRWARISRSSCTPSHEEYALARTERKTGHGYQGFAFTAAPEVSLAEDLARRDLTINAIARAADGSLIDPYRGVDDLAARVLRHVGPAFTEDPVRVLRLARFAARWSISASPRKPWR